MVMQGSKLWFWVMLEIYYQRYSLQKILHTHAQTYMFVCLFVFVYNFSPLSIMTSSALLCYPLSKTLTIHTHLSDVPRNSVFLKDNLLAISYQEKKISDYILFIYILTLKYFIYMFFKKKKKNLYHSRVFMNFTYVLGCLLCPSYLFCSYFCARACMLTHRCEFQNEMFNHQPESPKWVWHN